MKPSKKRLALDREFIGLTGLFYQAWTSCETVVDMAIGQLLKLEYLQTHILTSGMEFGRKARLLHELAKRSDHERRSDIILAVKFLRDESKRNVFAHSYMLATETTVTFVERLTGGPYQAKKHTFSLIEYAGHVKKLTQAVSTLEKAFGFTREQMTEFVYAAMSDDK